MCDSEESGAKHSAFSIALCVFFSFFRLFPLSLFLASTRHIPPIVAHTHILVRTARKITTLGKMFYLPCSPVFLLLTGSLSAIENEYQETMPWYSKDLPPQTALVRATTHLENARNSTNGHLAKKYCDQAQDLLERITIKATTSPLDLDQVISKYHELGAVLEKWEYGDKARLRYNKANELR